MLPQKYLHDLALVHYKLRYSLVGLPLYEVYVHEGRRGGEGGMHTTYAFILPHSTCASLNAYAQN